MLGYSEKPGFVFRPEMMCEHMLNMLNQWIFSLSELQISMQKYPVFSWDGIENKCKDIFKSN